MLLFITGIYKYDKSFIRNFDVFFLWLIIVSVIGYIFVPQAMATTGWARGSDGKPIIQFLTFLITTSFFLISYNALKEERDINWFFKSWIKVALLSASLCYIQSFYFLIYQQPLWSVFRVNDATALATFELLGTRIQRANALGGEPKQQGMHLIYGLMLLLYLCNRDVAIFSRRRCNAYILFILGAIILTSSTGSYLALVLYILFILVSNSYEVKKSIIAIFSLIILGSGLAVGFSQSGTSTEVSIFDKAEEFVTGLEDDSQSNLYGGDKELPASRYLMQNPLVGITGIGIGTAPFYYETLIPERWKGLYLTPNSGLLWCIYSFGIIGSLLFLLSIREALNNITVRKKYVPLARGLFAITFIYLLFLAFFYWSFFLLGIVFSPSLRNK